MNNMNTKTFSLVGIALAVSLLSSQCYALGWSVEAKSDVRTNTQEAGRDANRDSYNRTNSDNIGGNQTFDSHNRVNSHNLGNESKVLTGGVRIGHDYINDASGTKTGTVNGGENRASTTMGGTYSRATSTRGDVTGSTGITQSGFNAGGTRNNQSIKGATVIVGDVTNN